MTSYLVPGSPYLTFSYSRATPKLDSANGAITSFAGNTLDGTTSGKQRFMTSIEWN